MTSSRKVGNRFGYSKKETKENLDSGNKLEELLNKLIDKGWKPSGKECTECIKEDGPKVLDWKVIYTAVRKDKGVYHIHYSLRDIVSKESGLWQFVCENKLIKTKDRKVRYMYQDLERTQNYFSWYGYEYWLIESALCDEDKLEKFLLENIQIKGKKK